MTKIRVNTSSRKNNDFHGNCITNNRPKLRSSTAYKNKDIFISSSHEFDQKKEISLGFSLSSMIWK